MTYLKKTSEFLTLGTSYTCDAVSRKNEQLLSSRFPKLTAEYGGCSQWNVMTHLNNVIRKMYAASN